MASRRIEVKSVDEVALIGAWIVVSMVLEHFSYQNVIVEGGSLSIINDIKRRGGDPKFIHYCEIFGAYCTTTSGIRGYTCL